MKFPDTMRTFLDDAVTLVDQNQESDSPRELHNSWFLRIKGNSGLILLPEDVG
jgi:hypothetical protein